MFHFKHFSLYHENSALKISTDAVLLAAVTPVSGVRTLLDIVPSNALRSATAHCLTMSRNYWHRH